MCREGGGGGMRDDAAEILFQSFLREATVRRQPEHATSYNHCNRSVSLGSLSFGCNPMRKGLWDRNGISLKKNYLLFFSKLKNSV